MRRTANKAEDLSGLGSGLCLHHEDCEALPREAYRDLCPLFPTREFLLEPRPVDRRAAQLALVSEFRSGAREGVIACEGVRSMHLWSRQGMTESRTQEGIVRWWPQHWVRHCGSDSSVYRAVSCSTATHTHKSWSPSTRGIEPFKSESGPQHGNTIEVLCGKRSHDISPEGHEAMDDKKKKKKKAMLDDKSYWCSMQG